MILREVERIVLTETELQALIAQQFPTDRLRVVWDIFLFSCYTGLAYVDVKKLKHSELIIGVDGEQWLVRRRQKTDISARIPLQPAALTIINMYKDHPHCQEKDLVLPILSNQKEIADACGIQKTLTYHIATTVTLTNGAYWNGIKDTGASQPANNAALCENFR